MKILNSFSKAKKRNSSLNTLFENTAIKVTKYMPGAHNYSRNAIGLVTVITTQPATF